MNELREVNDGIKKSSQEVSNTTKAFDNTKSNLESPRHIKTINENLAGQKYPGTDVEYKRKTFIVNGEKVEGVFPVFDSVFNTVLPKELRLSSDSEQFKYCMNKLAYAVERNPEIKKMFTERQLEQIRERAPRISGLTWHHNEIPGKMKLVDSEIHNKCRHTGGKCIWGGGSENR